jgi:hypothetical protein
MSVEDLTTYERYLDAPGGDTLGWLARYGTGQAIWCGELSRVEFQLQSQEVRNGLRDDLGWFIVDYDLKSPDRPFSRILCKAACESAGLEVMRLIVQGRLCSSLESRTAPPIDNNRWRRPSRWSTGVR